MSALYIILAIGFLALQFYSSAKQQQREEQPGPRPVKSPLGGILDDVQEHKTEWITDFVGDEKIMEPDAYTQTGFQNEYFTYENTEMNEEETKPVETEATSSSPQETGWSNPMIDKRFDLRQAVIYQTILNRVDA